MNVRSEIERLQESYVLLSSQNAEGQSELARTSYQNHERTCSTLLNALESASRAVDDKFDSFETRFSDSLKCFGVDQLIEATLLSSLRFPTILERQGEIAIAYKSTFKWLFEECQPLTRPWSNFKQWLKTSNGVYWINGKAASGKSTLMRYILEQDQTQTAIKIWAGQAGLVTASFFFWNSGELEQKSHKGMLGSLLFQVLD
jgi:hypothetical protein